MNKTKRILKIIIGVLSFILAILLCVVFFINKPEEKPVEIIDEPEIKVELNEEQLLWKNNHNINPDYVGQIIFESGLINQPFVQAKSVYNEDGSLRKFYTESGSLVGDPEGYNGNDVYIWTNWKTGEYDYNDEGGSTFMEYRNEINDQNVIIYGHHFSEWNDETRKKAFTPLEKFLEEENYKENSKLYLILEEEKRTYELWSVYNFDVTNYDDLENAQYYRTNYSYNDFTGDYDENYYQNYIDYIESIRLYDTDVKLNDNDDTLTLQTCISGYTGERFEILVFKLTETEKWLIN